MFNEGPTEQAGRILEKLEQVRVRGLSCFGSEKHRFQLNPVLTEADLEAFERKHQVRLPGNYRTFLKHLGNGGAGPYYGIYPLETWNDFACWVMDPVPDDFLARPCPLRPELTRSPNWQDEFGEVSPYQGTLSLGSQGCTYAIQLVVTGPHAGKVVYVDADGQAPYMVHDPDFLSWYERWLDELLGGYETSWFGFGPGGGEDEFFQILDDSQSSDNVKAEAARAFSRLPRLSNVATSRIPKYLCHPAAGVRAEACATVGAFELRDAEEEVARLLEDPSSDVRREAVRTVMKLNPGRWTEAVLCRIREDSAENVVTSAFFSLKDQGALSKEELLRIVEHSPLGGLRSLAAHSVSWSAEDMDLLIHMLSDSQSQVRSRATLGLGQIKAHSAVPQLVNLLSRENDKHVISSTLKRLGELGNRNDYRLLVPILLEWAKSEDDFYRLDAIESLVKIGDERAIPIVKSMLLERRNPVRLGPHGLRQMSSVHTIRDLVRQSLKQSPSRALRRLAYGLPIYWWMWAILIPLGLLLGAYFAQGWHK